MISQQILLQKLEAAGRRYMRDLRRVATIDVKQAMTTARLPLAVTMGEPAGIGGELSLKAWLARGSDAAVLRDRRPGAACGPRRQARPRRARARDRQRPPRPRAVFATALPVLSVQLEVPATARPARSRQCPGDAGRHRTRRADGAGRRDRRLRHQSDPEEDAAGCGLPPSRPHRVPGRAGGRHRSRDDAGLPGACASCRSPSTCRWPTRCMRCSPPCIVRAGRIAAAGLKSLFGIARPRLAVAALNPHAGEQGSMGDEEIRVDRARRSRRCAPRASTSAVRRRPTRCSIPPRARPTTLRSACITTRR